MSLRCIFTSLFISLAFIAGNANADTFEKALMPGDLVQGHAKYENECNKCHSRFDKSAQTQLCLDCHKDIAADINNKTRLHGRTNEKTCRGCHTEHKGRNAQLGIVDKAAFDHGRTNFQLKGAHKEARVKCGSCHAEKVKYRDTPKLCNDCHQKDDQEKGHKGGLGKQCENCHSEKNWKEATFDHEKTKFPLAGGKHAEVKCSGCHLNKVFNNASTDCYSCHKKDDQDKGHKGRYSTKCSSCHTDKGWKELRFNHDTDTHYVLRAKHREASCDSCHLPEKGPLYQQKLSDKCIACHKKDDQAKGHRGELGEKCASCHNERGWKNSNFNHDDTHFPLHGKHKDAKCELCHKGGVSGAKSNLNIKLETTCFACHQKDDQEKGHKGRYGTKCDTCHTESNWKLTRFDHDRDTTYKLKDKHSQVKCDACHVPEKGALYQKNKLDTQCVSCHLKDDKHRNQLGNKCEACHNEKRWQNVPYDHNKARFALTGSHAKTECKKCHLTPAFHDAPMACNACHEKEDVHKGSFGTKCDTCHRTGTWKSWDFDHGTTHFPLDGGHAKVTCDECHKPPVNGRNRISKTCFSCHLKDDVHGGGFGAQCERCHTAVDWKKSRW